jgi:hypothetical protein
LVEAGEDVEGEVVEAAGEEGLGGFEEELIAGGGVGEEGHGGVELEVVGCAEDVADGVGGGFGERGDGVGAGGGARAEALDLREDEPDPVAGLALLAELAEDFGVDGGLGGEEALEVVVVGHGWSMRYWFRCLGWVLWVVPRMAIWSLRLRLRSGLRRQGARFARASYGTAEAVPLRCVGVPSMRGGGPGDEWERFAHTHANGPILTS